MRRNGMRFVVLSITLMWAQACATGTTLRTVHGLGETRAVATSADLRLVTTTLLTIQRPDGTVERRKVTCAEPSPDIAKAIADSFGVSSTFSFTGQSPNAPVKAALDGSGAAARGYAEAVAQMTERISTIQLLRDGLYRACEAFANGALDERSYAIALSRYDDTMITMLMADLVAGNFGRQLATLTATAEATASAKLTPQQEREIEQAKTQVEKAEEEVAEASEEVEEKEEEADAAADRLNDATSDGEVSADTVDQLSDDAKKKEDDVDKAKSDEKKKVGELAKAKEHEAKVWAKASTSAQGVGPITRPDSAAIKSAARQLVLLQENYLDDHNVDALMVRCLTATDQDPEIRTFCVDLMARLWTDHNSHDKSHGPSLLEKLLVGDYRAYLKYSKAPAKK